MNNAVMIIQAPRHQRDAVLASEIERLDPFQAAHEMRNSVVGALACHYAQLRQGLCDFEHEPVWSFSEPLPGRAY